MSEPTPTSRANTLGAVLEVMRAAAVNLDRRRTLAVLADSLRTVIPADAVTIVVLDGHGMFNLIVSNPPYPLPSLRLADYPAAAALTHGRPVVLGPADIGDRPAAREIWERLGWQTALSVPMFADGKPFGLLAFAARQAGAFDAIDPEVATELGAAVAVVIDNSLAHERLEVLRDQEQAANEDLRAQLRTRHSADDLIGDCVAFRSVKQLVDLVGSTDATVLLAGESGTGKDMVARAIHEASPRRQRPMVTINCAALPSNLAESELFGHEAGAFTGARARREGRFERASGGTLFLDEVGELPLDIQAKLLRVLQERVIERIGGTETIPVDLRIVVATNRDLAEMVATRRFREDLYYRLAVFPIELPPLRARRDDIPALIEFFVRRAAERMRLPVREVGPAAMARLVAYDWPGNVRELQNAVDRAMIVSTGATLELDTLLPPPVTMRPRMATPRPLLPAGVAPDERALRDEYQRVLDAVGWVIEGPDGAAARLGLHPNTLRYRLKRAGLSRPG